MSKDTLGDRMKSRYESCYNIKLPAMIPLILRCDGRGFSKYTKELKKPFDQKMVEAMNSVAISLCELIQDAKIAYTQSDEVSVLIYNKSFDSNAWYDNRLEKLLSVTAARAASRMTAESIKVFGKIKECEFDARVDPFPKEEIVNAFWWRESDAERNSVQGFARTLYSHKECHLKNSAQLKQMLLNKGVNWEELPTSQKRGRCIVKTQVPKTVMIKGKEEVIMRNSWVIDNNIPIFHQDRNYIDQYLE